MHLVCSFGSNFLKCWITTDSLWNTDIVLYRSSPTAGIYLFKANNGNTTRSVKSVQVNSKDNRTMSIIHSGILNANFEQTSHTVLMFL